METMKKLVKATNNMKLGNHRVEINEGITKYFYYATPIIIVDRVNRTLTIDNGGYGTSSTTRAINSYMEELEHLVRWGYEVIDNR